MDPLTAALIGILLLVGIGGVWGTLILRSFLAKRSPELGALEDSKRLEAVLDDHRQLEARFGQLEEEVSFLRQLREPASVGQLPPPDAEDGDAV